ncbi:glycosyltransferase family 2 protein [Geobacter pickeringii]|uniref:Glycosyltransferase 2-like domain-containing protein n=1 Tax=Geobacter pickeringii TaxID=345632 RepID=A0A0B5BFD4_9BACT|nr:glycosyltransferase family 2 protein [Geobacter pickeringii]AJE03245.1 hypothetical protein GPICK_07670 [Geobacter pickeringii]
MDISIIIVTYNSERFIRACFDSLQAHVKGVTYEIIVIDNCSGDNTCELIRSYYPSVCLIENKENVGFGRANNQAAAVAQGEYLFLLNVDTRLLDDDIANALRYARDHSVAVLGPKTIGLAGTVLKTWDSRNSLVQYIGSILAGAFFVDRFITSDTSPSEPSQPLPVAFLVGSAMVIDRQAYQRLGLFDEQFFFTGEERDLCMRYFNAGLKLIYYPGWSIFHHVGSGDGQSRFHFVNWIKSSRQLARKHGGYWGALLMSAVIIIYTLTYWMAFLFKSVASPNDGKLRAWRSDIFRVLLWSIGLLNERTVLASAGTDLKASQKV